MLFDPNHLKDNNETYVSHLLFALKIGLQLLLRSVFFILHSVFPFLVIPEKFNLCSTCKLITECYEYSKGRLKNEVDT